MFVRILTFSACLLWLVPAPAANYFKCVGPDGSVIFSDTECPDTTEVVTEKTLKAGTLNGVVGSDSFQETPQGMSLEQMLTMRSELAQVLSDLSSLKTAAAEYRASQGQWAQHLEALGFNTSRMKSSNILHIKLGREGAIITQLRDEFGSGKMVVLTPHEVLDGTSLEWDCAANFSPLIMEQLPCESRRIHQ